MLEWYIYSSCVSEHSVFWDAKTPMVQDWSTSSLVLFRMHEVMLLCNSQVAEVSMDHVLDGWVEKSQRRWQEIETSCITDTLTRCGCQVTVASVVPGQLQAGCASRDECASCARSPLPSDRVKKGPSYAKFT